MSAPNSTKNKNDQRPMNDHRDEQQPIVAQHGDPQPVVAQQVERVVIPFNEATVTTKDNFPSFEDLKSIFYKEDFDQVLNTVKNRMIQAKRANQQFARMTQVEFANIPAKVVTDVKQFLRTEKDFIITEIENEAGAASGWKITLF
jgi:hypothetical protein